MSLLKMGLSGLKSKIKFKVNFPPYHFFNVSLIVRDLYEEDEMALVKLRNFHK